MAESQSADPGSIPGRRTIFTSFYFLYQTISSKLSYISFNLNAYYQKHIIYRGKLININTKLSISLKTNQYQHKMIDIAENLSI